LPNKIGVQRNIDLREWHSEEGDVSRGRRGGGGGTLGK